jgi:hypothetical protein
MPCLLGLVALSAPRVVIVLLVLFSDYLGRAYDSFLWPVIGFFVAPTTTLAWAWAENTAPAKLQGFQLVVVIIAVLIDLGVIGGGRSWVAGRNR